MSYFITKEKKKELEEELKFLKEVKRKEISQKLDEAKALGDLKENAEYHQARDEQSKTEDRIAEIEDILKNAEIIKNKKSDEVNVGSIVEVEKNKKEKISYEIVGVKEVDIFENKISFVSPLGKVLMGKKKGDEFTFETPKGKKIKYKILNIK